ncbi:hypothetical protein DBR32_00745 [Taibaiella sp. KBW10]|uniref:BPTI/Kunitz-type proteinase inhibitor domain-containing protein n=1 Tax=Taibaiella sp. KBW10 TaxID=2153357 RepID=UPI000F5A80A6|nr:BPTI/Kunitz-type proteinase inhibitor domain-containing protein [Taibaiella sp. KBW10]RQO32175.1 hypothetical protein DBR32_00745 [Taibaiella sp. KBW10]
MKAYLTILAVLLIGLSSCSKKCKTAGGACNDTVPTNEACLAYFQRWFYNPQTNTCELKAYSGCSAKGFATEAECNTCKCKK